jgi:cobalt/nickel transport system permease protein
LDAAWRAAGASDVHHVVLERWSRGASVLHRRDPRAKLAALVVFLIVLATAHRDLAAVGAAMFLLLAGALVWARIPLAGALARAAVVLPFSLLFVGVCWLAGDPARGAALLLKSYLSALAVLTVVSTTPLPLLLRGMESVGAPRFLLMVAQFLYRYLFVISEEAQHMSKAAASRGATLRGATSGSERFHAAAGALAVLFARSYGRAEDIHRAMLARGFLGRFRTLHTLRFGRADGVFLALAVLAPVALRAAIERMP